MSVDYAAGLSYCDDLGVCGLDEVFDKPEAVRDKVTTLVQWLRHYNGSCVVHVGAGLSTAAGIRDFRGKRGVWTELLKGNQKQVGKVPEGGRLVKEEQKEMDLDCGSTMKPFDETVPTYSHLALRTLCRLGLIRHIVSQNVDGLFLKANLGRNYISELHGNFYLDECTRCRSRFIRSTASETMRLQKSNRRCPRGETTCKGYLRDTILDWESSIPYNELRVATRESKQGKLHICIGTSLQLRPSKDLVCKPSKNNSNKLAIINLQPTKFDTQADLVINYYADDVMKELVEQLDLKVPPYNPLEDPTKNPDQIGRMWKK